MSAQNSKVFLVTGSSRGLGRAIAEAVLAAGHRLVATARTPTQLADLVDKYGDQVRAVALDVTDPAAARAAVQSRWTPSPARCAGEQRRLRQPGLRRGHHAEDFREQIDTNLLGVVNLTKAALPVLREQGAGHIIQVSSVGGRAPALGLSAYQAAKWAVGGFSECSTWRSRRWASRSPSWSRAHAYRLGRLVDGGAAVSEPYRATVGAFAGHVAPTTTARRVTPRRSHRHCCGWPTWRIRRCACCWAATRRRRGRGRGGPRQGRRPVPGAERLH